MRALLILFSCLALLTSSFGVALDGLHSYFLFISSHRSTKPRPAVSPTIAPYRAPENWAMAPWAPKVPLALSPRHSGKAGNNFHKKKPHAGAASHYFPPKENCERITCSDPLTRTPIGSPCGCVHPIKVVIDVGVEPILLFPEIAELEIEVAAGTFLKQSQVRIMGADASIYSQERTTVSIYLVPLGERFDEMTALLIFDRFWQKKVQISASNFGDYEVISVHYPGLPSSPPPGNWGSLNVGPSGSREYPLTAHVPAGKKQNMDDRIIVLVSLSSFLLIFVCVGVAFIILKLKKSEQQPIATSSAVAPFTKRTGPKSIIQSSVASSASMSYVSTRAACPSSVKTFLLTDLMKATNGFSSERLLGEGGFGRVYLGIMEHGEKVAIKLLTLEEHNFDSEFIREVEMLCRMHHRNLVKLIGICIEGRKRCLAYELVCNGSVESHLHGADKGKHKLSWEIRMKIALGAARGLSYLHEDSNPRVIHRDFKASNVLLEEDFTPKVSDFGLAKEASDASHHISTRVMGTFGYVAPEYALTGHLLVKSDVYSYGVVLLELLTGRKPVRISDSGEPENLVTLARPLLTSKEGLEQLIDPSLLGTCDFDEFAGVGAVASMCVHPEASRRPFMGEVVQALKLIQGEASSRRDECSSSSFRDCDCKGEELGMESVWWSAGSPDRIDHRPASSLIESARSKDYCTRSESRGIERKRKKKSNKKNSALLGLRNAVSEPFGC